MFIGRKYELSVLEQMYGSDKSGFAVISGRRRVGKSTLIQEFNKDKNHIYYVGIEWSTRDNFEGLSH